jgi:hypothetical protein
VHAPCEDKGDDVKDSFYEELGCVFNQFPRYDMKILMVDLNAKISRGDIFKPAIQNESLYKISNDNGITEVNFATYKNSLSKVQCSPIATFINTSRPLLRERCTTKLIRFR